MKNKVIIASLSLIIISIIPGFILYNYARSPFTPGFGIFPTLNATDRDKAKLFKITLEYMYNEYPLPDLKHLLSVQGEPIVVTTDNIRKELTPRIGVYKTKFVEPDEIHGEAEKFRARVRKENWGPFMFLAFEKLVLKESDAAHVELDLRYLDPSSGITSPHGDYRYMMLNEIYIIFHKVNGEWIVRYRRKSIS